MKRNDCDTCMDSSKTLDARWDRIGADEEDATRHWIPSSEIPGTLHMTIILSKPSSMR